MKIILWIILIIVASPFLFGIGGGLVRMFGGLFGLLVAAVVLVGVLTGALFICGIALLIVGIVSMVIHPLSGSSGYRHFRTDAGICLLRAWLYAERFTVSFAVLFRSIVNGISGLLYGRRSRS